MSTNGKNNGTKNEKNNKRGIDANQSVNTRREGDGSDHDVSYGPNNNHNCIGCQESIKQLKDDFNKQIKLIKAELEADYCEKIKLSKLILEQGLIRSTRF